MTQTQRRGIANIVIENLKSQAQTQSLEFDLSELSEQTCCRLYNYVQTCIKENQEAEEQQVQ